MIDCEIGSHQIVFTGLCLLCRMSSYSFDMDTLLDEFSKMSIAPIIDYSISGLSEIHNELLKARAYSERASQILSDLKKLFGTVKMYGSGVMSKYEEAYDLVVVEEVGKHLNLSWEERASFVRVKCIDMIKIKGESDACLESAKIRFEMGEILAQSLFRARNDLQQVLEVLKISERLGEMK